MSSVLIARQGGAPPQGGGAPPSGGGGGGGGGGHMQPDPQSLLQEQWNEEYSYLYWKVLAGLIGFFILRHVLLSLLSFTRTSNQPKRDRAPYSTCVTHLEALANLTLRRVVFGDYRLVDLLGVGFLLTWNIVFLFVNTIPPHHVATSPFATQMAFFANRAGTLCFQNAPLVFALSGRSNVLSFLTGIEFNKLRPFHAWTGRVMFIGAVVHAALKSAGVSKEGSAAYSAFLNTDLARHGIIAVTGLGILGGISASPIRKIAYEFFLFSHNIGAALFLGGFYLHRPNHAPWVLACVALWSFDWLVRLCHIFLSHLVYPLAHRSRGVSVGRLPAHAEIVSGAVVLRIPYAGSWGSGRHVFVTYLDFASFWSRPWRLVERHPWSVANVSVPRVVGPSLSEKGLGGSPSQPESEMLLIIRPKGGMTKDLYRVVDGRRPKTLNVIVDGPYGKDVDARQYERLLLVAGGSGITHVLSVFLQMIERARTGQTGQTTAVQLVWAIQHLDHVRWVAPYLNAALSTLPPNSPVDFSIELWVTRPLEAESLAVNASLDRRRSSVGDEFLVNKKGGQKKAGGIHAGVLRREGVLTALDDAVERITVVERGRPDARTVVEEAARQTNGAMYLCACGPDGLSTEVQRAAAMATRPRQVDGQGKGFIKVDVSKFSM